MASKDNGGGQPNTGPIFDVPREFGRSTVLSLPVRETELFGQLELGRHGKSGNSDYLPDHIDTSTFLLEGVSEIPLHDHTADMLRPSLDLSLHIRGRPTTD